jgi:hypothetical protein
MNPSGVGEGESVATDAFSSRPAQRVGSDEVWDLAESLLLEAASKSDGGMSSTTLRPLPLAQRSHQPSGTHPTSLIVAGLIQRVSSTTISINRGGVCDARTL